MRRRWGVIRVASSSSGSLRPSPRAQHGPARPGMVLRGVRHCRIARRARGLGGGAGGGSCLASQPGPARQQDPHPNVTAAAAWLHGFDWARSGWRQRELRQRRLLLLAAVHAPRAAGRSARPGYGGSRDVVSHWWLPRMRAHWRRRGSVASARGRAQILQHSTETHSVSVSVGRGAG